MREAKAPQHWRKGAFEDSNVMRQGAPGFLLIGGITAA